MSLTPGFYPLCYYTVLQPKKCKHIIGCPIWIDPLWTQIRCPFCSITQRFAAIWILIFGVLRLKYQCCNQQKFNVGFLKNILYDKFAVKWLQKMETKDKDIAILINQPDKFSNIFWSCHYPKLRDNTTSPLKLISQ